MSKQRKKTPPWIKSGARGRSTDLNDTLMGYWFVHGQDWCDALLDVDERHDTAKLVVLLKSMGEPLIHVADLLERYELVRPKGKGRRPVPSYQRSLRNARLEAAVHQVKQRPSSVRLNQAVAWAAKEWGFPVRTLKANIDSGGDGGLRRIRQRAKGK